MNLYQAQYKGKDDFITTLRRNKMTALTFIVLPLIFSFIVFSMVATWYVVALGARRRMAPVPLVKEHNHNLTRRY